MPREGYSAPVRRIAASEDRAPTGTADIRRSYATASIISADRVVFNVKGNDYRLVVAVDFEKSIVWINGSARTVTTKIDVREVRHGGD
ncbi:type II toxin-antitoxin system HigB family toxin [Bradyrhizobium diazoefficiens]|uniref:type II toxin-antitoxin system HigB family toxin n=1 Tax=Bradyrhizobium diazoefficiens TaxID=1355477 RepID=UPI0028A1E2F2|nr:type II toxin-antitoxin system HigB family toxin [Bradyrhizobium diazoefficiens]